MSVPSASFALESLAERLGHDLRTRFPIVEVRVGQSGDHLVCEVLDGADAWGVVTLAGYADDEFSSAEIEAVITRVVTYVTDRLWPGDTDRSLATLSRA